MQDGKTENRITGYLLGELTDDAREKFEEEYFKDDGLFESVCAMEDELIHAYLQDHLGPKHRVQFEDTYLSNPRHREKVDLARELMRQALDLARQEADSESPLEQESPVTHRPGSFMSSLLAFLQFETHGARLSLASAALLALLISGWLAIEQVQTKARLGEIQTQNAELQRRGQIAGLALSFVLTPGLQRDGEAPRRLLLPPGAARIRLQLELESEDASQRYLASVTRVEGSEIWSGEAQPLRSGGSLQALTVELSAGLLSSEDYLITLKGLTQGSEPETLESYVFSVVRR